METWLLKKQFTSYNIISWKMLLKLGVEQLKLDQRDITESLSQNEQ